MGNKTVGIVEDDERAITPLRQMLTSRDFIVLTAATIIAARDMVRKSADTMDVVVLDMYLGGRITGAQFAIQSREEFPQWTPEFLILTGKDGTEDYYRQALRLGPAAYLRKEDVPAKDVVRYVRVLALKRSLRFDRPRVMKVMASIAGSTINLSEAATRFSRELLAEELDSCLDTPYLLLLSDALGTKNVATKTALPQTYTPLYAALQTMAHGDSAFSSPYEVSKRDLKDLPAPAGALDDQIYERLQGTVLLPLADVKDHRLSLALLAPRPGETKYSQDISQMAGALGQYVRPTINEHFLSILVHLTSHRKAMLKSVAYFCLNLGQHQQRIVEEGVARKEIAAGSEAHMTMAAMADDLRQTGAILNSSEASGPGMNTTALDLGKLIATAFEDYRRSIGPNEIDLVVEDTCHTIASRDDIYVAIKRLLDWMIQRRTETPPDIRAGLYLRCVQTDEHSTVIFEDRSRRLPRELREHIFEPFSASAASGPGMRGPGLYLPLYVAKVLFEEKYGGRLDDCTSEMQGGVGHRFVVQLAPPRQKADASVADNNQSIAL
jgi:DNA-binding NarL/FixJ family response regulator